MTRPNTAANFATRDRLLHQAFGARLPLPYEPEASVRGATFRAGDRFPGLVPPARVAPPPPRPAAPAREPGTRSYNVAGMSTLAFRFDAVAPDPDNRVTADLPWPFVITRVSITAKGEALDTPSHDLRVGIFAPGTLAAALFFPTAAADINEDFYARFWPVQAAYGSQDSRTIVGDGYPVLLYTTERDHRVGVRLATLGFTPHTTVQVHLWPIVAGGFPAPAFLPDLPITHEQAGIGVRITPRLQASERLEPKVPAAP